MNTKYQKNKFLLARHQGIYCIIAIFALLLNPAFAYHYPWDQGHDTTDWNEPEDPGPSDDPLCDPCGPSSTRSPVYTATGHFIWSENDIALNGRPLIALSRTYNSHDPRSGILGNGWSSNFETQLLKTQNEADNLITYVLRMPNGKRFYYPQSSESPETFVSPSGRFNELQVQEDGTVIISYPSGSAQTFNVDGNLISRSNNYGAVVNYEYNENDQLVKIADTNGRDLEITYNSGGRIASVEDYTQRSWTYSYDEDGNLASVSDPLQNSRSFEYQVYEDNSDGFSYFQLKKITDESGSVVSEVSYDKHRVTSYTEGENKLSYDYRNIRNNKVTKADIRNARWEFTYNDNDIIIEDQDPLRYLEKYEYDDNGKITKYTDKLNNEWLSTYDEKGRVTSKTDPLGNITSFEYTGNVSKPAKITSPSGRITEFTYDDKLNLTQVKGADSEVTKLSWSDQGDLLSVTNALEKISQQTTYNEFGLATKGIDALNNAVEYTYDQRNNIIEIKDPQGNISKYEYDALDRIIKQTDAKNNVTSYSYDAASRLLSVTAANGKSVNYEYDAYGRRIKRIDYDGLEETYQYRNDNLIERYTNKAGIVSSFTYDNNKQLTRVDVGNENITYKYNKVGLITQASNSFGSVTFSYDELGRVKTERNNVKTMEYSYNAEGELSSFKPFDDVLNYTYSNRGLITKMSTPPGELDFQYDQLGRRNQIVLPNGAQITYNYDDASQILSQKHIAAATTDYQYQYDTAGRITSWTGDGDAKSFEYDELNRLTRAIIGASNVEYSYDGMDNPVDESQVYDDANRLTEDNLFTYTYDDNGNLTRKQDKTSGARFEYQWTNTHKLASLKQFPDAETNTATSTTSYKYDAFGRRMEKKVDNVVTKFQWSGSQLIAEYNSSNQWIRRYYYLTGSTTPIQMEDANGVYSVHTNHLGAPEFLLDASQNIVWQADYDVFGSAIINADPDNDGNEVVVNFRLPGQYYDDESGLHYNYFRYYDPNARRYISTDPMGLMSGLNTYNYAGSNPIMSSDYFGLDYNVSGKGNVITISATITIYGPNASNPLAAKWQKSINDHWNNFGKNFKYKNCTVVFDVKVQADPKANYYFTAADADNKVYVVNSKDHRSYVQSGWYGQWSATDDPWVSAHEAGHLFGLPDDYQDVGGVSKANPGHAGHMMADFGGKVVQHEVDDILDKHNCNCKK